LGWHIAVNWRRHAGKDDAAWGKSRTTMQGVHMKDLLKAHMHICWWTSCYTWLMYTLALGCSSGLDAWAKSNYMDRFMLLAARLHVIYMRQRLKPAYGRCLSRFHGLSTSRQIWHHKIGIRTGPAALYQQDP
jgi:hypothetical protein